MLGGVCAGAIISAWGPGEAFLIIAASYACAYFLLSGVSSPGRIGSPPTRGHSVLHDLGEGLRYVRGHPTLVSILGVTALMNLFYFSFIPMVPVFADRLEVNALLAGLLASSNAFGSMLGTLLIARGLPFGRGAIYVGGSLVALVFLGLFASVNVYIVALTAMTLAGAGISGFATMQSVLVLTSASPEMRGRALGLLSTAIGALPFSMFLLGLAAEATNASAAMAGSVSLGFVGLVLWTLWRPQAARLP
jgi:hypothetical protein